jgi:hypothetical protein
MSDPAPTIPEAIEALASARAEARSERDYARADRLKAEIEAAGWKVVDDGARYMLTPALPPDRRDEGRVVYGSAASVPSRLDEGARPGATVVVVASGSEPSTPGALAAAGSDVDLVLVAADGSVDRMALLERLRGETGIMAAEVGGRASGPDRVEVLWTSGSLGAAEAVAAGIRRVGRELVILLETGVVPAGDLVTPLATALDDPTVAAVGVRGLTSSDLHRFVPTGPGDPLVALGSPLLAFRRRDVDRLAGLDRRLVGYASVVAWSSLALREAAGDAGTRRVALVDLPVRGGTAFEIGRRDRYRIAARFGGDPALRVSIRQPSR